MLVGISGFSQTIFGVKANPTFGFLRSSHLKQDIAQEKSMGHYDYFNYHTTIRFGFGFGGYVEHFFTPTISGLFEPTINFISCHSNINSSQDSLNSQNTGSINKVYSEADIHLTYFNLPFLGKYIFDQRDKFYAIAGPAVNFFFTPHLFSKESTVYSSYTNGILESSTVTPNNNNAKLNSFSKININFIAGVGKTFHLNGRGRDMNVEIRYNLPITGTSAFTNSTSYSFNTYNNSVYGYSGKSNVDSTLPHKLDNFRYSSFTISFGFTLFEMDK